MALTFGVDTTGLSWGVFQEHEVGESVELAEARDENGKVTDEKAYSKTARESGRFLLNGSAPSAGSSLNLGGSAKLITEINYTKRNTGYADGAVTTQKKDSATQVAYS